MNDYNSVIALLEANDIKYRTTAIYDEQNNEFKAIWLETGHIEFDENDQIKNVVNW